MGTDAMLWKGDNTRRELYVDGKCVARLEMRLAPEDSRFAWCLVANDRPVEWFSSLAQAQEIVVKRIRTMTGPPMPLPENSGARAALLSDPNYTQVPVPGALAKFVRANEASRKPSMPDAAAAASQAYEATRNPVTDVPWESLDPFVRTVATNAVRYVAERFSVADAACADRVGESKRYEALKQRNTELADKAQTADDLSREYAIDNATLRRENGDLRRKLGRK